MALLLLIRSYWSIEAGHHQRLDVTAKEDSSRRAPPQQPARPRPRAPNRDGLLLRLARRPEKLAPINPEGLPRYDGSSPTSRRLAPHPSIAPCKNPPWRLRSEQKFTNSLVSRLIAVIAVVRDNSPGFSQPLFHNANFRSQICNREQGVREKCGERYLLVTISPSARELNVT